MLPKSSLEEIGKTVDDQTATYMARGGIGVHAKPVLDRVLDAHGLEKNDSNRSWLGVNAAEHSQILAFLCLKDVGLQADYSLDRAIQVAMGVADKMVKNIDPASSTYGRAIEELTKAISDSAIPRNFRGLWDKLTDVAPAAAKDIQETASRAAGCAVDDFSIFQLNSALARAGHVNQQESN